jgi:hypothetical protein
MKQWRSRRHGFADSQGEAIGYPFVRAAEGIKLNFLVDVPQDQFVEISETEMSKMQLRLRSFFPA